MKLRRKPTPEPMIFGSNTKRAAANPAKVKDARYGTSVNRKKTGTDKLEARKQDLRNPLLSRANSTGTRLSDSDSDELYLPAVNEAIRMLDLDSQATQTASISVSTWSSSIGYCSSLLQQFVAKSQSGEPPPPPPQLPPILQLTKGARKCFPTLVEEPTTSASSTTTNESSRKALPTEASRSNMDHELGLDCHPSHVSPDSGIQSVAGSPFSVNSSPVHPGSHSGGSQHIPHQPVILSPCPPVPTPSPPPPPASKTSKKNRNDSMKVTTALPNSAARRRRSCRDTASALSSGLQKDSSFVQAIQRGLDAALRLTAQTQHADKNNTNDSSASCSRKRSRSSNRSIAKAHDSVSIEVADQFHGSSKPLFELSCDLTSSNHRQTKQKKKRKKEKSSQHHGQPASNIDLSLQYSLEQLCKTLDRCTISRISTLNIGAMTKPWVFQCRKYPALAGSGGGSKPKRKKMEDDSTVSKRRGKWKKNDAVSAANTNGRGDSQAAVANAVELLLPLKKRHHLVPPYESLAPTQTSSCTTEEKCTEKASQEQVLTSRKRVANGELESASQVETVGTKSLVPPSDDVVSAIPVKKKKVKRSKKKFRRDTESPESDDLPTIEEIIASVTCKESTKLEKKPSAIAIAASNITDGLEQPPKKKNRRRKAFNRTGFPSIKKKRKKLSPPILEEKKPAECHQPKRARFMKDEDDIADVAENLPELTSSESPSSDELVHISLPSTEAEPKKRRIPSWRKRFLTAGLFSNFFKENPSTTTQSNSSSSVKLLTYVPEEHEYGLLPPPFHSERYLRRRRQDYQLPYNLWWLHQQGKLPGRDTMVPSWNYRKIRSNVYYDVKPPFTNDAQACNCTYPPPNAKGILNILIKTYLNSFRLFRV